MKEIKKEIKFIHTFIILFIVCSFLLLFNIIAILSKQTINKNKDFEKISQSVVSIHNMPNNEGIKKGSGFIYKTTKDRAYILTNNHLVENSYNYKVYISENESVPAKLHGYDKYLDIAVLSIENNNYKALKLDKNNKIKVGDNVYTIGTPLDNEFFNTTTKGMISKTNRMRIEKNSNEDILMNMIQMDMIINPGNSGGPLLNEKLEVIGVVTSKIDTTNINGISFSVPISQVLKKLDELEKDGEVSKRKINNLEIVDIKDSEKLYKNDLINTTKEDYGVVVLKDNKDSSLKKGDIILEIDNNKINDIYYYNYYLNQYKKNEKITLTIKRNEKEKKINITLQ